jgi:hypothetical protein
MQIDIRNNRDVWAGVLLIVTGTTAVIIARNYAFGTALRMGPGYFPSILGGLLVLFGLYLVAQGLRTNEQIEGNWSPRALIVGSAAASREFKLVEVLLLAVGLTAFAVALFIYGLGLPYPLFSSW